MAVASWLIWGVSLALLVVVLFWELMSRRGCYGIGLWLTVLLIGQPLLAEPLMPAAGGVFQDRLRDGSLGPKMVVIPEGRFQMGCVSGKDCDRDGWEEPVHPVRIGKAFALGQTEVTFADYDKFAEATGAKKPDDKGWGRGNRPVINVNWEDAKAYAEWLSKQTGKSYRLPSEAEWEYAARAGTTRAYWWGDKASHEYANYGEDECCGGLAEGKDQWKYISPAASFAANPFGLYDMHGNVWEWLEDCWHKSYEGAPSDGSVWSSKGGGDCGRRVLRGGSWGHSPDRLRSAYRLRFVTFVWSNIYGFRLAQDLPLEF